MSDTTISQTFSEADLAQYGEDGFVVARSLFADDEISKLLSFARGDDALHGGTMGRKEEARQLYQQIVDGEWANGLQGYVTSAKEALGRL